MGARMSRGGARPRGDGVPKHEQARMIVEAQPGGMTAVELAVAMKLPVARARSIMSRTADYFGFERVSVPLPNGGRGRVTIYRAPRPAC